MARLLMKALRAAGFAPSLASELRTLDAVGSPSAQERHERESAVEAARLTASYHALPAEHRPRLWFTYHVYYKAPDWIGPAVSAALRIPYCVAEGSRAGKRAAGPWARGHAGAEAALDRADAIFVMTAQDREALERARRPGQILVDLPPFLETSTPPSAVSTPSRGEPRLLTVAMMRAGDKLASYRLLADALEPLQNRPWTLDVVGDGEARGVVEGLFRRYGDRVRFHGEIDNGDRLLALYAGADLFVWPAVNEAYGMVFLEAQSLGCPVVAGAYGGVPSVVRHGTTGLLAKPGDPRALATLVERLLMDRDERRRLGDCARRFVHEERSLSGGAERLRAALLPLAGGRLP